MLLDKKQFLLISSFLVLITSCQNSLNPNVLKGRRGLPLPTKDEVALVGEIPFRLQDYLEIRSRLENSQKQLALHIGIANLLILRRRGTLAQTRSVRKLLFELSVYAYSSKNVDLKNQDKYRKILDQMNLKQIQLDSPQPLLRWIEAEKKSISILINQHLLDKIS